MTNYEKIKEMSFDDLAKYFADKGFLADEICRMQDRCPYVMDDGDISDDCNCTTCVKNWLDSEVTV